MDKAAMEIPKYNFLTVDHENKKYYPQPRVEGGDEILFQHLKGYEVRIVFLDEELRENNQDICSLGMSLDNVFQKFIKPAEHMLAWRAVHFDRSTQHPVYTLQKTAKGYCLFFRCRVDGKPEEAIRVPMMEMGGLEHPQIDIFSVDCKVYEGHTRLVDIGFVDGMTLYECPSSWMVNSTVGTNPRTRLVNCCSHISAAPIRVLTLTPTSEARRTTIIPSRANKYLCENDNGWIAAADTSRLNIDLQAGARYRQWSFSCGQEICDVLLYRKMLGIVYYLSLISRANPEWIMMVCKKLKQNEFFTIDESGGLQLDCSIVDRIVAAKQKAKQKSVPVAPKEIRSGLESEKTKEHLLKVKGGSRLISVRDLLNRKEVHVEWKPKDGGDTISCVYKSPDFRISRPPTTVNKRPRRPLLQLSLLCLLHMDKAEKVNGTVEIVDSPDVVSIDESPRKRRNASNVSKSNTQIDAHIPARMEVDSGPESIRHIKPAQFDMSAHGARSVPGCYFAVCGCLLSKSFCLGPGDDPDVIDHTYPPLRERLQQSYNFVDASPLIQLEQKFGNLELSHNEVLEAFTKIREDIYSPYVSRVYPVFRFIPSPNREYFIRLGGPKEPISLTIVKRDQGNSWEHSVGDELDEYRLSNLGLGMKQTGVIVCSAGFPTGKINIVLPTKGRKHTEKWSEKWFDRPSVSASAVQSTYESSGNESDDHMSVTDDEADANVTATATRVVDSDHVDHIGHHLLRDIGLTPEQRDERINQLKCLEESADLRGLRGLSPIPGIPSRRETYDTILVRVSKSELRGKFLKLLGIDELQNKNAEFYDNWLKYVVHQLYDKTSTSVKNCIDELVKKSIGKGEILLHDKLTQEQLEDFVKNDGWNFTDYVFALLGGITIMATLKREGVSDKAFPKFKEALQRKKTILKEHKGAFKVLQIYMGTIPDWKSVLESKFGDVINLSSITEDQFQQRIDELRKTVELVVMLYYPEGWKCIRDLWIHLESLLRFVGQVRLGIPLIGITGSGKTTLMNSIMLSCLDQAVEDTQQADVVPAIMDMEDTQQSGVPAMDQQAKSTSLLVPLIEYTGAGTCDEVTMDAVTKETLLVSLLRQKQIEDYMGQILPRVGTTAKGEMFTPKLLIYGAHVPVGNEAGSSTRMLIHPDETLGSLEIRIRFRPYTVISQMCKKKQSMLYTWVAKNPVSHDLALREVEEKEILIDLRMYIKGMLQKDLEGTLREFAKHNISIKGDDIADIDVVMSALTTPDNSRVFKNCFLALLNGNKVHVMEDETEGKTVEYIFACPEIIDSVYVGGIPSIGLQDVMGTQDTMTTITLPAHVMEKADVICYVAKGPDLVTEGRRLSLEWPALKRLIGDIIGDKAPSDIPTIYLWGNSQAMKGCVLENQGAVTILRDRQTRESWKETVNVWKETIIRGILESAEETAKLWDTELDKESRAKLERILHSIIRPNVCCFASVSSVLYALRSEIEAEGLLLLSLGWDITGYRSAMECLTIEQDKHRIQFLERLIRENLELQQDLQHQKSNVAPMNFTDETIARLESVDSNKVKVAFKREFQDKGQSTTRRESRKVQFPLAFMSDCFQRSKDLIDEGCKEFDRVNWNLIPSWDNSIKNTREKFIGMLFGRYKGTPYNIDGFCELFDRALEQWSIVIYHSDGFTDFRGKMEKGQGAASTSLSKSLTKHINDPDKKKIQERIPKMVQAKVANYIARIWGCTDGGEYTEYHAVQTLIRVAFSNIKENLELNWTKGVLRFDVSEANSYGDSIRHEVMNYIDKELHKQLWWDRIGSIAPDIVHALQGGNVGSNAVVELYDGGIKILRIFERVCKAELENLQGKPRIPKILENLVSTILNAKLVGVQCAEGVPPCDGERVNEKQQDLATVFDTLNRSFVEREVDEVDIQLSCWNGTVNDSFSSVEEGLLQTLARIMGMSIERPKKFTDQQLYDMSCDYLQRPHDTVLPKKVCDVLDTFIEKCDNDLDEVKEKLSTKDKYKADINAAAKVPDLATACFSKLCMLASALPGCGKDGLWAKEYKLCSFIETFVCCDGKYWNKPTVRKTLHTLLVALRFICDILDISLKINGDWICTTLSGKRLEMKITEATPNTAEDNEKLVAEKKRLEEDYEDEPIRARTSCRKDEEVGITPGSASTAVPAIDEEKMESAITSEQAKSVKEVEADTRDDGETQGEEPTTTPHPTVGADAGPMVETTTPHSTVGADAGPMVETTTPHPTVGAGEDRVLTKRCSTIGKVLEHVKEVTIDVEGEVTMAVINKLERQGRGELIQGMEHGGKVRLIFHVPSMGLMGLMTEMRTEFRGSAIVNDVVEYEATKHGRASKRERAEDEEEVVGENAMDVEPLPDQEGAKSTRTEGDTGRGHALDEVHLCYEGVGEEGATLTEEEDKVIQSPVKGATEELTSNVDTGADEGTMESPYRGTVRYLIDFVGTPVNLDAE